MLDKLEDDIGAYIAVELLEEEGGQLPPDTVLLSGLLDSWSMMELVSFLEETYNVQLEMDEFTDDNFKDVRAVAALVQRKVQAGQAT